MFSNERKINKMNISLLHSGGGDWVGLYIDGILIEEDHNLSEDQILDILAPIFGFSFESFWDKKESYLERYNNHCPKNLPSPDELKE
jgi:hypothetical protein